MNVQQYYDDNTHRFLNLGHGGRQYAIRRAVWGPGANNRDEAIDYVNKLILDQLLATDATMVVDLGCGVGGSMLYLKARHRARYLGATISGTQVEIGSSLIVESGFEDVSIVKADFTMPDFPDIVGTPADVAFAVESLIHVDRLTDKFSVFGSLVRPGGRLIICDDMLAEPSTSRRDARWLKEFRNGWFADGLIPRSDLVKTAGASGFHLVEDQNLTDYLELDRPRDRVARVFIGLTRWSPYRPAWFLNLLGGNALQQCLKNSVIQYRFMIFERQE